MGQAQSYLDNWEEITVLSPALSSYHFVDIASKKTIATHNSDKLLNPASTIKLFTSLIYLESKGDQHRHKTTVGYKGKISKDGTLHGDIIVKGSGDPSFGSARYGEQHSLPAITTQIIYAIKNAGITCIEGDIVVDTSPYGTDCVPHSWLFNDLGNYYAAGVWGLNANENAYELSFKRSNGKEAELKTIDPFIPTIFFENELELGAYDSGDQAYIFCAPYQKQAYIRGSIPKGKGLFSIRGSIPDAPNFFAYFLSEALDQSNIKSISTQVSYFPIKMNQILWEYEGAPAITQVKSAIEKSINMYCEAFLLDLGNGDRENGIQKVKKYLKKNNIIKSERDLQISDGSGLSQRNYLSTKQITDFLIHQSDNLDQDKLYSILARNGYDGTLKNAFIKNGLKGKIHGKSGSMGGVRAYAGFLETKSRKTLGFSIMINNYTSPSYKVIQEIEKLLLTMYNNN